MKYWLISLVSTIPKHMEKALYQQIITYLWMNVLIHDQQYTLWHRRTTKDFFQGSNIQEFVVKVTQVCILWSIWFLLQINHLLSFTSIAIGMTSLYIPITNLILKSISFTDAASFGCLPIFHWILLRFGDRNLVDLIRTQSYAQTR